MLVTEEADGKSLKDDGKDGNGTTRGLAPGQVALADEVCLRVIELMLQPDARPTEWLLRKALQRDGQALGNGGREVVGRRCLGITSLLGRLMYIGNEALRQLRAMQELAGGAEERRQGREEGTVTDRVGPPEDMPQEEKRREGKRWQEDAGFPANESRRRPFALRPPLTSLSLPLSSRNMARLLLGQYILHHERSPDGIDDLGRGLFDSEPALFALLLSLPPPTSPLPDPGADVVVHPGLHDDSKHHAHDATPVVRPSPFQYLSIPWPSAPGKALAAKGSLPLWLAAAWIRQYGWEDAAALTAAANAPGPVTLRWNMLRGRGEESWVTGGREGEKEGVVVIPGKGGRREDDPTVKNGLSLFLDRLVQDGIRDATPCPWSPVGVRLMHGRPPHGFWGLSAWKEGWFEVQDEGSQLVALATRVKRGEEVLDLCAGNGGKTLAMASWILRDGKKGDSEGRLWVYDTEQARLKQLLAGARRMGAERLVRAVEDEVALEALMGREEDGQGKGKCDVVLVDAPCSSTGVLRRRPSLRWNLKPDAALNALPAIQRQLLVQAQRYVKVGGRLVYATCSLLEEENEKVVAWFLEEFGSGAREGGREGGRYRPLPWAEEEEPLRAAAEAYGKRQERAKGMIKDLAPGMLLLMPHVHGTDGFFIARFERYR